MKPNSTAKHAKKGELSELTQPTLRGVLEWSVCGREDPDWLMFGREDPDWFVSVAGRILIGSPPPWAPGSCAGVAHSPSVLAAGCSAPE